jgi:hypothetical protein
LPSLTKSRLHPAMVSERKEFPRMGVLLISSRDCFDGCTPQNATPEAFRLHPPHHRLLRFYCIPHQCRSRYRSLLQLAIYATVLPFILRHRPFPSRLASTPRLPAYPFPPLRPAPLSITRSGIPRVEHTATLRLCMPLSKSFASVSILTLRPHNSAILF